MMMMMMMGVMMMTMMMGVTMVTMGRFKGLNCADRCPQPHRSKGAGRIRIINRLYKLVSSLGHTCCYLVWLWHHHHRAENNPVTMVSNAQCAVWQVCLPRNRTHLKICVLIYHLTYICPSLFDCEENMKKMIFVIFKL